MKRLALLVAMSCLTSVASAQTGVEAPAQPDESQVAAPDATGRAVTRELDDRHCLKHTGTRLSPRADRNGRRCANAAGRAYSRDDLDRTGAVDLADALRRLDPALR